MDKQTSQFAVIGDESSSSQPVFRADGQYDSGQVLMNGSVTILLDEHKTIHLSRPQLLVKLSDYTWFDKDNKPVLRHSFNDPLKYHHLWKDDETQSPCTVDFDIGEIGSSKIRCSDNHHPLHDRLMLSYEFTNFTDYQRFQTMFRGKAFIRDYDITFIDCSRHDTLKEKKQCIKLWKSDSELFLTIPLSQRSSGPKAPWKIKHIEIMARWMEWESVKTKAVKAEYKKTHKTTPLPQEPTPVRRRSSLLQAFVRSKHPSPSVSSTEEEITANPSLAQQWPSFLIKFSSSAVRDEFLLDVTEASFPAPPSPPSDATMITTSLPRTPSVSTAPHTQTTSATSVTGSPSPPDTSDSRDANEPIVRESANRELDTVQEPPHKILKDDYMRVGGLSSAPRPVYASPSQIYKKLADTGDGFRILQITGGKHKSPLCCSLVCNRLATAPKYEALSYCWGTEVATRTIPEGNLRGCLVSEHLWRALKRLRMPSENRLVWIDAICINQQDIDERNHQLGLMRHIYAKALRTIIWIGDFDPTTKSCKRAFLGDGDTDLTLCVSPGLPETEHENAVEDLRHDLRRLQVQSNSKGTSDVWWRRLWCIQEFHFSANKPSVYIGPHAVKWGHFHDLFDSLSGRADHPLATFQQLRDKTPKSLVELLALTGAFNSSDPRDRIFALLGMAPAAGAAIPPDYRHSVIRVIEEAVLYLIEESSTVDVLLDERPVRHAWGKDQLVGVMPSWIPDLTCLLKTGCMFDSTTDDVLDSYKYKAGLPTLRKPFVTLDPAATRWSDDGSQEYDIPRTMHCRAWYFDVITNRVTGAELPTYEKSPNGFLIYNSRQIRGKIIDWILDKLEYDFDTLYKSKKRTKHGLDPNPRLGLLLLDYLLEGQRSHVEELASRIRPPERNVVRSYEHQRDEDLKYVREESKASIVDADADIAYIQERWRLKITREENNQRFIPKRLEAALRTKNKTIQEDFEIARDLGNLFAYVRGTRNRFYLNRTNFDAPMRKDVLGCSSITEVRKLGTQFEAGDVNIEIHEYNAKSRERDFFKTKAGFLGLGPACLEVGDKIVVPLSASRPFILREDRNQSGFHTLVGEAVVPSIMSGKWATLEKDSFQVFKIK